MGKTILEPAREIPVIAEADLLVAGGSCTGVFAAVRAARLGLQVVLIEKENMLGGTAVTGLVNIWHTLMDMDEKEQIIAGLTDEVIALLKKRGALDVAKNRNTTYNFNPNELTITLDDLVRENRIRLMLHTSYAAVAAEGDTVKAVFVETKDGRRAIKARFFIDATGDGLVARDLGMPSFVNAYIQPPTACFHYQGDMRGVDLAELTRKHGGEFGLSDVWGWSTYVAGMEGITMSADNHIYGVRCDRAEDLTRAELEGRRQVRAFVSLLQKYGRKDTHYALTNLFSSLGLRETVHYATRFQASETPLLTGARYGDPILNGTYPVDIHHANDNGITFKYLDGRMTTVWGKDTRTVNGNWREELGLAGEPAKYYQVPFEILVGERFSNFVAVGRILNADSSAYGALRVMVNLNQIGEAAGAAAALCLDRDAPLQRLDGKAVALALRKGGSAL